MSKDSIQEFSTSAASNTDIAGINVNTGWPPGNVGSATRTLMAMLASLAIPTPIALGSTTVTLTAAQASQLFLQFTGTPGGTCTVTLVNHLMAGWVQNTSASSAILTTGAGMTVTVPNDSAWRYYTIDGSGNVASPTVGAAQVVLGSQATAASTQALRADQTWQEIGTYTGSAVSSVLIPLSTAFRLFRLSFFNCSTSSISALLGIQFSANGGSTYFNTGYAFGASTVTSDGATGFAGSASSGNLPITPNLSSASTNGWAGQSIIYPGSANNTATAFTQGAGITGNSGLYGSWQGGGAYKAATVLMNYMAITRLDAGLFTGTFILEGLP